MAVFSLIIPCYNESKSIPLLIESCVEAFNNRNDIEVILVDNGSIDGSYDLMSKLTHDFDFIKVLRVEKNIGYGNGIIEGINYSNTPFIGWTHADLQTDPKDFLRGVKFFEDSQLSETLFVKGSRYGRPLFDIFFTVCMSIFESLLFKRVLWDINAQPNIFHRDFFESLDQKPSDFSLDLFIYFSAKKKKLSIKRFPVNFGERKFGKSHWNIDFKSKLKFIKRTYEYSIRLKNENN